MKNNGKKELTILLLVIFVGIGIFAGTQLLLSDAEDGGFSKNVEKLSSDKFFSKIDAGDDFILVYESKTCSACIAYKPDFAKVAKEEKYKDVPVYYIEAESLSTTEKEKVTKYLSVESTPTTYIIIDGNVEESVVGSVAVDEIENTFDLFNDYK